jgi:adenylate cyclase class 2
MDEIEIKFALKDTQVIAKQLLELGFRVAVPRHLEKNYLFDNGSGALRSVGKVLRVRQTPSTQTVTYKGPIVPTAKLKQREEIECRIEDAQTIIRILEEVGFKVRMQYSKVRTVFESDGLKVSVDETEAGDYLEIEGPSDEEIIKLGARLGYSEQDFVRRTYSDLIGEKRRAGEANERESS